MKKRFTNFLIIVSFLIIGVFALTNQTHAETEVSGNITSDTTWTLVNSPYTITDTIQILHGATLTIEPGVIVNGNSIPIQVGGKLNAIGTSDSKIVFNNIKISGIGTNTEHFEINVQFSEINSGPFYYWPDTMYGSLILRDSKINNSSFIFLWYPTADSYIERNIFTNTGGISVGARNHNIYIRNNIFYNITNWQGDSAIEAWANNDTYGQIIVEQNSFLTTNRVALRLPVGYTNANMMASNNYWSTTDESVINSMIFDKNDDLGSANYIVYLPILTEPHPNTPIFSVTPIAPTCTSWTYSDWMACSSNGQQARALVSSSPSGCVGGSPVLTQSCAYIAPVCTSWAYSNWETCTNGQQTRNVISSSPTGCAGGISNITRSCIVNTLNESEQEQTCSSFIYSNWSNCTQDNIQLRSVLSSLPNNCSGGRPTLSQTCVYVADQVNTNQTDVVKTDGEEKSAETNIIVNGVINREQSLVVKKDTQLTNRLKGKILLQVESKGEAWYVSPSDGKKIYMANGNEAYNLMRNKGVGISNKDLGKINTDKTFAKKNSGKIFLQVEARGEAYYIDFNGVAHYLKDGTAAYEVMRSLGLGISNKDIRKVEVSI